MGGILRQPLFWFILIGVALFVADSRMSAARPEIHVTAAQRERLATLWKTQTGLTVSEAELDSLVQNWIREEVMYREALRLGLDEEDSIVRRRLVQKLGFIAESAPAAAPEAGALESFYAANLEKYTLPERYSLRQLYFSTFEAASAALFRIEQEGEAASSGEATLLNANYAYRSALDLNANFGFGFAEQLLGLAAGRWQGPLRSSFGFHLVYLTSVEPQQITPFDEVRSQVEQDFLAQQQDFALESYAGELLDQYTIVIER